MALRPRDFELEGVVGRPVGGGETLFRDDRRSKKDCRNLDRSWGPAGGRRKIMPRPPQTSNYSSTSRMALALGSVR
jgi:hypothetical protein